MKLHTALVVLLAALACTLPSPSAAQVKDLTPPNLEFTPSMADARTGQSGLAFLKVGENRGAGLFKSDQATHGKILQGYGKLPLSFEVNQGQTDARVKFLSRRWLHAFPDER